MIPDIDDACSERYVDLDVVRRAYPTIRSRQPSKAIGGYLRPPLVILSKLRPSETIWYHLSHLKPFKILTLVRCPPELSLVQLCLLEFYVVEHCFLGIFVSSQSVW